MSQKDAPPKVSRHSSLYPSLFNKLCKVCSTRLNMSKYQLSVATRANQAALLPVLLVATSVNNSSPMISISYEDTAILHDGDKAIVQLKDSNGTSVFGTGESLKKLLSDFAFLHAKDEKLVMLSLLGVIRLNHSTNFLPGKPMAFPARFLYYP